MLAVSFRSHFAGLRFASLPCFALQCTGAGGCLMLVGVARIVRRRVAAAARIVQCSVSFVRAARSPATRRCSRLLTGARCSSPRKAAPPPRPSSSKLGRCRSRRMTTRLMCTRDKINNVSFILASCKVTLAVMYLRLARDPWRARPHNFKPLLRRLRLRHKTSTWASGDPTGVRREGA